MIKIKGKKLPPEETYTEYTLLDNGEFWYCSSHQVIFEAGEKVLQDGKDNLKCPLDGCNKYGLTYADWKYYNDKYILEKWQQTYTPFSIVKNKTWLQKLLRK
jgi:hypothetical protein